MTAAAPKVSRQFPLRPHPHLYEINTWVWLEELSAPLGRLVTLADVPDAEWDALAQRGFDIIWLMGVWQRSPESRRINLADPAEVPFFDRALPGWKPQDVIGSPYAVRAYVPDARIGTWDAIDAVREKLHARGMALFLDFVGNHTALDHPWTRDHPEFYVQGSAEDFQKDPASFHRVETPTGAVFLALARDPYFPPWDDIAQLNHFSSEMRAAQLAELRAIASHCDGVRCDMAMLNLNDVFARVWGQLLNKTKPPEKEFWGEARAAVPDLRLLAEVYWGMERRLLDLGFSFAYDKGLYDAVRSGDTPQIHSRLAGDLTYQSRLARFLENHDEDRCVAVFGKERLSPVAALMGTLPGMRLYHQGELEGRATHLPITLRMGAKEAPDASVAVFFDKVLRITAQDVFHHGEWTLLQVTSDDEGTGWNLVAYEWRSDRAWKVIVVNLASTAAEGRVSFDSRLLPATQYIFQDELDSTRYVRDGDELRRLGLFVRRDGNTAHLFDVSAA